MAEQQPTGAEMREAIRGLTADERRDALNYLVGYAPEVVASALAHFNETRERSA